MFRRKRMPAHLVGPWEAFSAQAARVEGARRALIGCLPVGRVEPAPVSVGLDLLRDELRAVGADMGRWKVDEVARHWEACATAVADALDMVEPVREVAETTDEMQHVVEGIAEIADALDPWYDAERYWLTLRVRQ